MLRILQISDTHLAPSRPEYIANWHACVRVIEALAPDLVINSGDITLNGAEEPEELPHARALHDALPVAWRTLAGKIFLALLTYFLVNITWVFFRAQDFETAWRMITVMLGVVTDGEKVLPNIYIIETILTIGAMLVIHWRMRDRKLENVVAAMPTWLIGLTWSAMLFLIIITQGGSNAFIYFQF